MSVDAEYAGCLALWQEEDSPVTLSRGFIFAGELGSFYELLGSFFAKRCVMNYNFVIYSRVSASEFETISPRTIGAEVVEMYLVLTSSMVTEF